MVKLPSQNVIVWKSWAAHLTQASIIFQVLKNENKH